MDFDLAQKAICAAINGNWKDAVKLNQKILNNKPKDIDALNRLAKAYLEVGNLVRAKQTASEVLKIDPFNPIATRALNKWRELKSVDTLSASPLCSETFLEEPGKTKIVSLMHLGSPTITAKLDSGDVIKLDYHPRRVAALTENGKYVGRLPDDLSARLKKLASLGYTYQVLVKSINPEDIRLFLKETKKGKNCTETSFPLEKVDYISFTPPELVNKKVSFNQEQNDEE